MCSVTVPTRVDNIGLVNERIDESFEYEMNGLPAITDTAADDACEGTKIDRIKGRCEDNR